MLRKAVLIATLAAGSCAMARSALAQDNPLGFYVGAGLGRSALDQSFYDQGEFAARGFNDSVFGWKAVVGVRPSPWLGGELEYIDFGNDRLGAAPEFNPVTASYGPGEFLGGHADDRAAAAFAVGYLPSPLPAPFPELFGKLGWAQLWSHYSYAGDYPNLYTGNGVPETNFYYSDEERRSGLAYGGGLQSHFGALAVRLEYERIAGNSATSIQPSLLSVGLLWTF
jgi:opacity protein-like surface antigen